MPVPAFCDTCGAVFTVGIVANGPNVFTFSGTRAGPCPSCGGMGHIPDGIFSFVGETIEVLSAPERTLDELSRLVPVFVTTVT